MYVIKRNGQKEEVNPQKIKNAISAAFKAKSYTLEDELIDKIVEEVKLWNDISIEDIQDEILEVLRDYGYDDVADCYNNYRIEHKNTRFIMERLNYMDTYSKSKENAASSSETDANANVTLKNIANLEGEVYKTTNRIIQRQRMKDRLNIMFPDVAKQYERDLNNHIIYVHDEASSPVAKPYCMASTLYPLMAEGVGNIDGVTPTPPNDIQSFSGQVTNLVFLLSSQVKGAVALGDYLIALNYYVVKEFGSNWYDKVDVVINNTNQLRTVTIKNAIEKGMKQFIYGVNQPAGNRSYNSPFTNISYYDHTYFTSLFEDFYYPDGSKPEWKAIDKLQRMFMELHRQLRLIKPLTFPVSTIAMVHDNKDIIDKEYKELCAEEWAKGGSFFAYINNSPTSLASCCFSKDTKFLWKASTSGVHCTSFAEYNELPYKNMKENMKVFHNGSWVSGKVVELPNRPMYKITTFNNKEFIMTDNHINPVLGGEKTTSQLTLNDYLLFNTSQLSAIPENNEYLTFSQGFVIGSFIGDGSFGPEIDGTIYETIISQNKNKVKICAQRFKKVLEQMGLDNNVRIEAPHNNVYNIRISCKELVAFIIKWTNWFRGTYAFNKKLNLDCLLQSSDFRKGILAGWYNTDGGNSNRCYTTSSELAEQMEILITSLGMQSTINISDRTDEKVVIRDNVYNRNYPLYCVRWYENANHRQNKDKENSWIKYNNGIYFKIKSIEKVNYNDKVYCIECKNQKEPYFTLPSGLITHNCRVLNEMDENTFSSTTGMTGIMTGSCNVITLNLNRIIQDFAKKETTWWSEDGDKNIMHNSKNKELFKEYLTDILKRVYKYHIAYKTILYELEDRGMFAPSNGGYIYLNKLYSTIGLIGYFEAAKFLGIDTSNNEEYFNFLRLIFGTVKEQNKLNSIKDKKKPILFNSEAIPGENLAVNLYKWDMKDGYWVPEDQNLYNCYFYNPWDDTSVLDKFVLHGSKISKFCDGGQALHCNLDEHLSKEQYLKLIDFSIANGTNYFTFNIPISECKDCGHVVNAPIKECPICHSKNIDYWTRIIGYLRPVSAFSKPRQIEQKHRTYSKQ